MTRLDLTRGACVGHPEPDLWFSDLRADKERARAVCRVCPVQRECGVAAVTSREFAGIRAGLDGEALGRVAAQARAATATRPDLKPSGVHATCGKPSGVRSHRRAGEIPCGPCRDAAVTYRREARQRQQQRDQQDQQRGEHDAA